VKAKRSYDAQSECVSITQQIREAFASTGKKQAEIARDLDVDPKTVFNWADGITLPDAYDMKIIAKYVNKTVASFYGEEALPAIGGGLIENLTDQIIDLEDTIVYLSKKLAESSR
jgi:transcriptional regulator with XRE-family HTH domain